MSEKWGLTLHRQESRLLACNSDDEMGGEMMDLEMVKKMLGWDSPIGVGVFFVCSGITVYVLTLALQNIVNL
jgi:hypothetical protein